MSTPLFSKLMKVQIDSSTIGCATDFSLSINKDMLEFACLDSEGAKMNVPDMYSWNVSGSGMVFRDADLDAAKYSYWTMADSLLNTDASILVSIKPDVSSNSYYSGVGYFSALGLEGGVGAPVSYSFEITGSGPLEVKKTAS